MRTGPSFAAERGCVRSSVRGARSVFYGLTLLGLGAAYAPTAPAQAQAVETTKIEVRSAAPVRAAEAAPKAAPAPAAAAEAKAPEAGRTAPVTAPVTPSPAPSTIEITETATVPLSPEQQDAIDRAEERKTVAAKRDLKVRISEIETRMEAIDQRRSDGNIAGPIAMLTAGYTTGIAALGVSLAGFAMAEQVEKRDADDEGGKGLDVNNDGNVDGDDEATFRRVARGMGVASAIGMGIGIAGNVILAKRLKERRQYDPELRELKRQRRDLRRQLDYAVNASPTTMGLALTGRF
jgi:hypothetical protein